MRRFSGLAVLALVIGLAGTLPLAADDQPQCPLCGNKDVKFEDSPVGALRKFQFAMVTKNAKLMTESMLDPTKEWVQVNLEDRHLAWQLLAIDVKEAKVDGDHARIEFVEWGSTRREVIDLIRKQGLWRLDLKSVTSVKPASTPETIVMGALKQLISTEGVWRQTDSDRNGVQDYWTRDIAGFYGMTDAAGSTYKYIDIALAKADTEGAASYPVLGDAAPKAAYWFRVMKTDEEGKPYQKKLGTSTNAWTNESKYGFCAYPADYGKTGTLTFIVNEAGVIYQKDLGPDAKDGLDTWPAADPTTKGWVASD